MAGTRRTVGALVLSFAVYLAPLVGPHAAGLLGQVVWRELSSEAREPMWAATDIGVALAAQLALFLLAYWFLGRPGWLRGLVAAVPLLPAIIALNYLYMIAIPARFLIEADTAPERVGWPLACTARDVWVPEIRAPISGARAGPIWVAQVKAPIQYGLLDASDCSVRPLDLTHSGNGYVTYAAAGRALYMTMTPPTARQEWSVFDVESGARIPLEVEPRQFPVLSTDGRFAAWLRPAAGSTPPIQLEAVVRPVGRTGERVVDLSALGRGGLDLVQFDAEAGTLTLARGLRELWAVDLDGRARQTLAAPAELAPQPQTFRLLPDGWVAWDAYRDAGPYRVAWSLAAGNGAHRVPKGRSITGLAPSPDGRWIALSVTSNLSIGSTPDAVSVLRTADGSEAFRRYFPKYTRSAVAFAGPGRFVYSDLGGVNVVRIE